MTLAFRLYGVFDSVILCLTMPFNHGKITVTHSLKRLIALLHSSSNGWTSAMPLGLDLLSISLLLLVGKTALISGPNCKFVKHSSLISRNSHLLPDCPGKCELVCLMYCSQLCLDGKNEQKRTCLDSEILHWCTSNLALRIQNITMHIFFQNQI